MTPLESETSALALSFDGERETDGPNDSPAIRQWLAHVNLKPPQPYCAAFVSWVIFTAGMRVPVLPKFKRSAGALRLLDLNPGLVIFAEEAVELLATGVPLVFVQKHTGGKGHCGFALALSDADHFESMEANTGPGPNVPAKDRDGQGCYRRQDRHVDSVYGWMRIT